MPCMPCLYISTRTAKAMVYPWYRYIWQQYNCGYSVLLVPSGYNLQYTLRYCSIGTVCPTMNSYNCRAVSGSEQSEANDRAPFKILLYIYIYMSIIITSREARLRRAFLLQSLLRRCFHNGAFGNSEHTNIQSMIVLHNMHKRVACL